MSLHSIGDLGGEKNTEQAEEQIFGSGTRDAFLNIDLPGVFFCCLVAVGWQF